MVVMFKKNQRFLLNTEFLIALVLLVLLFVSGCELSERILPKKDASLPDSSLAFISSNCWSNLFHYS